MPSFEQYKREQPAAKPEQLKSADTTTVFNRAKERIQLKSREVQKLAETGAIKLPPQYREQIAQATTVFTSRTMEALASLEAIRKKPEATKPAISEEKDPWAYFDPEEVRKTNKPTKNKTVRA